jgi:hypothetical protein
MLADTSVGDARTYVEVANGVATLHLSQLSAIVIRSTPP